MTGSTPEEIEALLVHEPFLKALARAVLRGEEGVDDVVQETWAASIRSGPRSEEKTRPWLAAVTRNFARKLLRSDRNRARRERGRAGPPGAPTPDDIAEREETRRRVLDAVLALEEPYRGTLLLRYYEDLPPREVAKRMDVPAETARTRVRRGLERLRQKLEDDHHGDRRAWILALVAFAGLPVKAASASVVAATVTAVALPVVLVSGLALGWFSGAEEGGSAGAPMAQPAPVEGPPPVTEPPPVEPVPPPEKEEVRIEPAPLPEVPKGRWDGEGEPPGMVPVPAGTFTMGVDEEDLRRMFEKKSGRGMLRDAEFWWPILLWETPRHEAKTEAYAIDVCEVTNAQYWRFLEATKRFRYLKTTRSTRSIHAVATLIHGKNPRAWQMEAIYRLNRRKLDAIESRVLLSNEDGLRLRLETWNSGRPRSEWITGFSGLPEKERIDAWCHFQLPEGLEIEAFARTVPRHWRDGRPSKDQLDEPVRYVSWHDAAAFAEWAGKHVPTEEEWEKAARGPKETLYPWGNTWDCEKGRNRVIWNGADSPPAAPRKDRPAPVDSVPEGKSGYGCFHMLGNVTEWTSSYPRKYPGCRSDWEHWDEWNYFVLRGGAWGFGHADGPQELSLRNTTRILTSPDGPILGKNLYESLGFRCARYPTPMRDVLAHRIRDVADLLPGNLGFDPAAGFGVEQPGWVVPGEEGPGKIFVVEAARGVGFLPVTRLPFATVQDLLQASREGPRAVYLGYLYRTKRLNFGVKSLAPGSSSKVGGIHGPGVLLGLHDGKLGVFALDREGPRLYGTLWRQVATSPAIRLAQPGEPARSATLDPANGAVRFQAVIPLGEEGYGGKVHLEFRLETVGGGVRRGTWLETRPHR